jgi:hypothetical protein
MAANCIFTLLGCVQAITSNKQTGLSHFTLCHSHFISTSIYSNCTRVFTNVQLVELLKTRLEICQKKNNHRNLENHLVSPLVHRTLKNESKNSNNIYFARSFNAAWYYSCRSRYGCTAYPSLHPFYRLRVKSSSKNNARGKNMYKGVTI